MEKIELRKYDHYKDSGINWINDIPVNWNVTELGKILDPVSVKNQSDLPLLSITREKGVILRGMDDEEENHNYIPDDLSNYKVLLEGQFGMNKMKAWQGSYGISKYNGIVSPAYYVFNLNGEIEPAFFHWAIRSRIYISYFGSASDGVRVGQWDLSKERMKRIPFVYPPKSEQTAIAAFLDRKTAKIDEAIAIKQRQIELLKERRQILIHRAVTRGLNPNVKMKDSGVEWIGEIPTHWEVKRFTKEIYAQEGPGIMASDFEDKGVPLIRISGVKGDYVTLEGCNYLKPSKVQSKWKHFRLELNDLVISGSASTELISEVDESSVGAICYTGLIRLRPRSATLNREYLKIYLGSKIFFTQIDLQKTGSTISHFGPTHLQRMIILVPEPAEQIQIVAYVKSISKKIFELLESKQSEINALREFRAIMINNAVTGKIKVC